MKIYVFRFLSYLGSRIHHMFDSFTRDLSEHRVLLNWIYAFAYLALIFYCVQDNPGSQKTAIVTTGGIISTIFTGYILGTSYEKVNQMKVDAREEDNLKSDAAQERAAGD